jgi:hypothetical protein
LYSIELDLDGIFEVESHNDDKLKLELLVGNEDAVSEDAKTWLFLLTSRVVKRLLIISEAVFTCPIIEKFLSEGKD